AFCVQGLLLWKCRTGAASSSARCVQERMERAWHPHACPSDDLGLPWSVHHPECRSPDLSRFSGMVSFHQSGKRCRRDLRLYRSPSQNESLRAANRQPLDEGVSTIPERRRLCCARTSMSFATFTVKGGQLDYNTPVCRQIVKSRVDRQSGSFWA